MAPSTALFLVITTCAVASLIVLTAICRRRDIQAELDIARETLRRSRERLHAAQAQLDALGIQQDDTGPIPPVPPATPEEGLPA